MIFGSKLENYKMVAVVGSDVISQISRRRIKFLLNDPVKSAEAVNLVYVKDSEPGIVRKKVGKGFIYLKDNRKIDDTETLGRIKKLVLPPAWKEVWICSKENGHLQATGIDTKNRKQYKYHPLWCALRSHTKYYRLYQFGCSLPQLRKQIQKDLKMPGLPVNKVLAAVVSLMQRTNIRIGNCFYEKENGSFGITTLKDKHVEVDGTSIKFSFKGKKGVFHDIHIKSRQLAKIVKSCQDIPGKELFQYLDENGRRQDVDSGLVNEYIRNHSGGDFTAKDLRTWSGSVQALLAFKELGICDTQSIIKKNVVAALDLVSTALGNTRTVCKKYYIHPTVISMYEDGTIDKYLKKLDKVEEQNNDGELTCEEKVLMEILKNA